MRITKIPFLMVLLSGCSPDSNLNSKAEKEPLIAKSIEGQDISELEPGIKRFTIESHGQFRAGFDNGIREILIITDNKTKKTYLGITGVGITELHKEDKSSVVIDANGNIRTETITETKER